jgi:colanic acid biosynthesis glycosyl transferase WcaI
MRIIVVSQNYPPEEQNLYHHEFTSSLVNEGHHVTMLTAFPHHGRGRVYDGYRGKLFQRETLDGVKVIRSWVYAKPGNKLPARMLTYFSFCVSSLLSGLFAAPRADVVYTSIPPLPLGITGYILARLKRAKFLISIQDIFPQAAVELGMLRNPRIIRFFERMERWVYQKADRIVVIADGFKRNLIRKGVPPQKVFVVSNWADTDFIKPGPKDNGFRRDLKVGSKFTLIYSGGLTLNSNVAPMIEAADILRTEPFAFVIIGDGVHKQQLQALAREKKLTNLQFLPFQPRERYPEVLLAADMNLVALNSKATDVSVPSKVYKQMACGRPVLVISSESNELAHLIMNGKCGLLVAPDNVEDLVAALRWAASHPDQLAQMGTSGRTYLVQNHSREYCVRQIDQLLGSLVSDTTNCDPGRAMRDEAQF